MTQPPNNQGGSTPDPNDNPFDDFSSSTSGDTSGSTDSSSNPSGTESTGDYQPPSYPQYGQTPYEASPQPNYGSYGAYPQYDANQGYNAPGYSGQGYPPAYNQSYGYQEFAAGPWRRLAAHIVDMFLLGIVLGIALIPYTLSSWSMSSSYEKLANVTEVTNLVTLIGAFVYFTIMHTTNFSSIGKRLLGIRVTTMDLQPISFGTSALRSLWLLVGAVPMVGGFLFLVLSITIFIMVFMDDKTQGLHDKWSKTRVVMRSATNY